MNDFLQEKPLVYLITDGAATAENFTEKSAELFEIIEIAIASKVQLIQIREKKLPAKLVFKLAAEAARIARNSTTKILVNDRADIALAAKADGVHLASQSLPAKIVRRNFPENFIIGVSTHALFEAETARSDGANFVTFSPIFQTPSKENYGAPQGVEKLREVCKKLESFPVVALGGINETNYKTILGNGASGFAAIRFLNNTENLKKLAANLRV